MHLSSTDLLEVPSSVKQKPSSTASSLGSILVKNRGRKKYRKNSKLGTKSPASTVSQVSFNSEAGTYKRNDASSSAVNRSRLSQSSQGSSEYQCHCFYSCFFPEEFLLLTF